MSRIASIVFLLLAVQSPAYAISGGFAVPEYEPPAPPSGEELLLELIDDCLHQGLDYIDWGYTVECVEPDHELPTNPSQPYPYYELEDCMIIDPQSCWTPIDVMGPWQPVSVPLW